MVVPDEDIKHVWFAVGASLSFSFSSVYALLAPPQSAARVSRPPFSILEGDLSTIAQMAQGLTKLLPWLGGAASEEEDGVEEIQIKRMHRGGRNTTEESEEDDMAAARPSPTKAGAGRGGAGAMAQEEGAALREAVARAQKEQTKLAAERDKALSQAERLRAALDALTGRHTQLEARYGSLMERASASVAAEQAESPTRRRGGSAAATDDGYALDSVSVVLDASKGTPPPERGYAVAVKRLEDRVHELTRQLAEEREAHAAAAAGNGGRRGEDSNGDGYGDAASLGPAAAQSAQGPSHGVGSRVMQGEQGDVAAATQTMMDVLCSLCVVDNSDLGLCMKAVAALAVLSRSGTTARALLAAGAAAAVADTMLLHAERAPALQAEALRVLYFMAGGLAPDAAFETTGDVRQRGLTLRDAAKRDHMAYECAQQSARALVVVAERQLEDPGFMTTWGHCVATVGRVKPAAKVLMTAGVLKVLVGALRQYAAYSPSFAPLHACAVAVMSLAASGGGNRLRVADAGALTALQRAMQLNGALAKCVSAGFPMLVPWLNGQESREANAKRLLRKLSSCGRLTSDLDAEALWLATARSAAVARSLRTGRAPAEGLLPPARPAHDGTLLALLGGEEGGDAAGAGAPRAELRGGGGSAATPSLPAEGGRGGDSRATAPDTPAPSQPSSPVRRQQPPASSAQSPPRGGNAAQVQNSHRGGQSSGGREAAAAREAKAAQSQAPAATRSPVRAEQQAAVSADMRRGAAVALSSGRGRGGAAPPAMTAWAPGSGQQHFRPAQFSEQAGGAGLGADSGAGGGASPPRGSWGRREAEQGAEAHRPAGNTAQGSQGMHAAHASLAFAAAAPPPPAVGSAAVQAAGRPSAAAEVAPPHAEGLVEEEEDEEEEESAAASTEDDRQDSEDEAIGAQL